MTDIAFPLFPLLSLIGFVLSLIPLPWHLQVWNSGTCYFMIWSAISCLNKFVNSIVWAGSAADSAPALCEICASAAFSTIALLVTNWVHLNSPATRITIGASVGIPAASLCINRRLYMIARVQAVSVTRAEKRRAVFVDSLICVLLPVICIVLAYIVQGHRYNIFEDLGCHPAIYNTLPAFFLVYMWPVVIGSISAVYCILSLRCLIRRQIRFNQLLSSNPSLTSGRYFRLMALALTDLVLTVPFGIYEIYSNAADGNVYPWKGWADTHYNFSRVESFPARLWRAQPAIAIPLELNRWIVPACAFVFFAYFGFAEEARKNYSAAYCVLTSRLACLRRSQPPDISKAYLKSLGKSLPPYPVNPSVPKWPKSNSSVDSTSLEPASPTINELKTEISTVSLADCSQVTYSDNDLTRFASAV